MHGLYPDLSLVEVSARINTACAARAALGSGRKCATLYWYASIMSVSGRWGSWPASRNPIRSIVNDQEPGLAFFFLRERGGGGGAAAGGERERETKEGERGGEGERKRETDSGDRLRKETDRQTDREREIERPRKESEREGR